MTPVTTSRETMATIQIVLLPPPGFSSGHSSSASEAFGGRSFVLSTGPEGSAYQGVIGAVFEGFAAGQGHDHASAEDVAAAIYGAATDDSRQLRYIVGGDAVATLGARAAMDDVAFLDMMRGNFGLLPNAE